jgi:hypothetical protein
MKHINKNKRTTTIIAVISVMAAAWGMPSMWHRALFPVETRKFGYAASNPESAEETFDERVKKKADHYCK